MAQIIQPFGKLQNSVFAIDGNGILVLRDYAENVKRMLEMIDQIDVSVPAEYISEVIPIKYAMAGDIANALGSLGGSGNGTVSIGGSTAAAPSAASAGDPAARWALPERAAPIRAAQFGGAGQSRRHAAGGEHFSTAVAVHHQPHRRRHRRRSAGPNPAFWPDQNHCRPAQQFAARFCHATGHGHHQDHYQQAGRAAFASAHRGGHHGLSLGPTRFNFGVSAAQNPATLGRQCPSAAAA